MTVALALSVEADGWETIPALDSLIQEALDAAAALAGVRLAAHAEVSVLLCDDAAIRSLNATWRNKDAATNVLSFPATLPRSLEERLLLGDIAIAWETTAREAEADGKRVADHLAHLVIHGFLHLIGFDHEDDADASIMERLEVRVLAQLGIDDPYAGAELTEQAGS